jgi:hypothetical protein
VRGRGIFAIKEFKMNENSLANTIFEKLFFVTFENVIA